jgi:hypothetical protein
MREPVPARPSRVVIALGVAGAFAGPSVGLAVAPELRLAWRASPSVSVALLAAGPGFGARVSGTEGAANVRQELALLEVALEPQTRGSLSWFVDAGGGAYHLYASGDATPPYTSGHDDVWAALLSAGVGLRLRVTRAASIVADVREVLALPRPVVLFAAEQVATSMHPGTLGGLSLAVDL